MYWRRAGRISRSRIRPDSSNAFLVSIVMRGWSYHKRKRRGSPLSRHCLLFSPLLRALDFVGDPTDRPVEDFVKLKKRRLARLPPAPSLASLQCQWGATVSTVAAWRWCREAAPGLDGATDEDGGAGVFRSRDLFG